MESLKAIIITTMNCWIAKKIVIIILLVLSLFGCSNKTDNYSIYVISDTHYMSDSLVDPNNKLYTKKYLTPDCRNQEDEDILIDALIDEINDNNIDLVVFTGDLSFHGAIISLEELTKKSKELYETNEINQYKDEGNEPISLKDLEARMNKQLKTISENFEINRVAEKPT